MRLLVCTQALDPEDPVLGFFYEWVRSLAAHSEGVVVLCLRKGKVALPDNVVVIELPQGKIVRVWAIWKESVIRRATYDGVFVHMNPEYVVASGILWRLLGKKIGLWYTHKHVSLRLRVAVVLAHIVLSASKESFRLSTRKLQIMGHGISEKRFTCPPLQHSSSMRIVSAGRLSRTKNVHVMIEALSMLRARSVDASLTLIGTPATKEDETYMQSIYDARPGGVTFAGPATQEGVKDALCEHEVALNLSSTGSMDKAVLEALFAGRPVVSSNEAFKPLLAPYGLYVPLEKQAIAEGLLRARTVPLEMLYKEVRETHSLEKLIPRIIAAYGTPSR